jgi:hypothetical protein
MYIYVSCPQNYSCDFGLSAKQAAEVIAYGQLIKESLHPALQYLWWVQGAIYIPLTLTGNVNSQILF